MRTTIDTYELQANYGYGWEYLLTEYSWCGMRDRLREYRENMPEYSYRFSVINSITLDLFVN